LRVAFAGTPEFARVALDHLQQAGHTIVLVLCQPDRPAGRGMKLQACAVKQFAQAHQLPVIQPRSLRLDGKFAPDALAARQAITAAKADVMVVAAYGLLLPQWVLEDMGGSPGRHGCLNIHASLLPRWRGAAPIHRAIEAGDALTGVTIMQMDAGLDTGDMLLTQVLPIADTDTTAGLHDTLAECGASLMVQTLQALENGQPLAPRKQPPEGVTYAHKVEKAEAAIDWRTGAAAIVRRVRAFNPFPVASFSLQGEAIKVWAAEVVEAEPAAQCGTVVAVDDAGIWVAALHSMVRIVELQRPGGRRLRSAEFLRGFALHPGTQLDLPDAMAR